ncbi:amino acid adenylation domain-containing protein [Leptolyngbya sp. FACHB-321]|uniref:non-ribosomal peptide synthetase n=1 Tax=Leptolyngbya sp. FACHB-321 TaxID=2692807 RepID=UPI00168A3DBA|nr:amino acid adenylation domain-containing protein [Leptolyngbya sp. FACHB-321]
MVAINQDVLSSTEDATSSAKATAERADLTTANRQTPLLENAGLGSTANLELSTFALPSDFLKTPATIYQPKYCALTLPDCLVETLQAQAQQDGVDERSLLLAAFNALLYRYTQQETIDLALTISTDANSGTRKTETCTQIHSELKVHALIKQISTALSAVQAMALPVVPAQLEKPSNDRSSLPVAVTFIEDFLRIGGKEQWLADFPLQASVASDGPDLHLILLQRKGSVTGVWQYNASLFHAETIQRLSGHLQVLLQSIVNDQDCTIAELPLLTQVEIQQLLVEWQSATISYPQTLIHQLIEAHAIQQPEAIALTFNNQQLTYVELNQRANQVAHYLVQAGVSADVRVAVCVEPSLEIVVTLLGIFKAGGVYLPLDPTHPIERLTTILEETQPKVLLTQSHLLPRLPAITDHILCLDQEWTLLHQFPTHNPEIEVRLEQTSHLVYTSGTTGKPKGVITSHGNLVQYILSAQERFGFDCHDVMPAIARFTFSITMFELLSPLVAGGKLVILEREHILDFQRMVQTLQQATVIHTSPSLLQKLLTYVQDNNLDLQSFQQLKHVSTGGDMVPTALLETMKRIFQSAEVYVIYGCSEVSCMGCSYPVVNDQPVKSRVGKPFTNVSVRLYDSHLNLVPIGIPGEIYIGGAGVTQGYLQREALTQEKFVTIDGCRFYRTGDIGRFDMDGNLEMLGRADFQIKLRGIRIELGEIEATLRQAPGVREGVVMARELGARAMEQGEKSLVAYVVLDQAQKPPIENIRSLLQEKLPDYMVPSAFVVLDAMPVNINQKVDRRALPLPTPENIAGYKAFVAPRDEWEQQLTTIWETVLGVSPIGIHDNFFEVGGHSLLAASLMIQIEAVFGQTLPLSTLLTEPTIAQLAALLSQPGQLDRPNSVVLLRKGGSKPPVFFIHDGEGETLLYRNLAYCLKPEHPVYGIQPYSQEHHPILHTRVVEMAAYYIEQIRTVQPEGPYLLGGLCVGGFLAFEMARQLQNQGQTIAMVALLDTADVEATMRSGLIANQRLSSFSQSLNQGQPLNPQQLLRILGKASQKIYNVITYEVRSKLQKVQNQTKIKLFRYCLDRNLPIPSFLHNLSVRIVLKFAEREYIPQAPYQGEVFLTLATQKSSSFDGTLIDDTPYADMYSDPLLGWGNRSTEGVKVYHSPGGHSSMLQEPNVQVMAENMQSYIDAALAKIAKTQPLPSIAQQPEKTLAS